MKITIIAAGKLKERLFSAAAAEYIKRLGKYAHLTIAELSDESGIEQRLSHPSIGKACKIAMTADGEQMPSETFAAFIRAQADDARRLVFIIGGAEGLPPEILTQCNRKISFSKMTFPHQLFRVMLLEQLYRACKINKNEPYHK